jgi:hypothetical protein
MKKMNNTNLFDIELDAEILDLVNFLEESERQSTGFVTKKRILDNAEGWCRVLNQ